MKETLIDSLQDARRQTDLLFSLLEAGALYERPIPERHRLIFYLGHIEAFDWNQIAVSAMGEKSFNSDFDRLFEAGIDPDSTNLPTDAPTDWPKQAEVCAYNRRVRDRIDEILPDAPETVAEMALEHRLMHAETLAYLLQNLPYEQKRDPGRSQWVDTFETTNTPVEIAGGLATLGRDPEEGFGWDNEFPKHFVRVPAFCIDRYKVTNGEYLEFVKQGTKPPHFWTLRNGKWFLRGMFELVPLPLNAPVYVTRSEAEEYAIWKNKHLPTEAQYHRAAYGARDGEHEYPWGDEEPAPGQGAFDFQSWDPVPVAATPTSDSHYGVAQLVGNGWEWTSTVFQPFPGFEPSQNYPGYSQNFFDGHHYVLKGASCRTARRLMRRSFRNWFRPDYPYVYSTFRLVEN
ncbi:MAG TPA: SUMF1/EgtB/PvdO family nonheme iron enzyme [Bryobacteraceae bacterium]|nr:SUMF1/EgtB/PvdO family nonheme iron enzyme [Bryobacteraceae bacterium]